MPSGVTDTYKSDVLCEQRKRRSWACTLRDVNKYGDRDVSTWVFHHRKCWALIQGFVTVSTSFNSRYSTTESVGFNGKGGNPPFLFFYKKKGAGFMLAPYFFHKTRVQKSDKEICTLFFSFVPPRIAQEGRL